MNTLEFLNEFVILYNNIMSNAAPGLNSYEVSVFLTKALEEIVKSHSEPLGNKYKKGLDDSPKRLIDFSELIRVGQGILIPNPTLTYDDRSKVFKLPDDVFLISNESIKTDSGVMQVIPITYIEYTRFMSKPYKEPLKFQAWRIITDSNNNITVEIIPHTGDNIIDYKIKYIKKPAPIIVEDLSAYNITIDGINTVSECELNPIIHQEILLRAVELAKSAYQGDLQSSAEFGNRSE